MNKKKNITVDNTDEISTAKANAVELSEDDY